MSNCARSRLTVPIVGDFQIGKSTLVNCLLEDNVALMGKKRLATTKESETYPLNDVVAVCDTPGTDDPEPGIADKTEKAVSTAEAIVFVVSGRIRKTFHEWLAKTPRIPCVVLYNCMDEDFWNPQCGDIADICADIEREELAPNGNLARCIVVQGHYVWPVNILWGLFGLGLLDDEKAVENVRCNLPDGLGINVKAMTETDWRNKMWELSGIEPFKNVLLNLPLELLKHVAAHPDQEIDRIVNCFDAEFKKRWSAA